MEALAHGVCYTWLAGKKALPMEQVFLKFDVGMLTRLQRKAKPFKLVLFLLVELTDLRQLRLALPDLMLQFREVGLIVIPRIAVARHFMRGAAQLGDFGGLLQQVLFCNNSCQQLFDAIETVLC